MAATMPLRAACHALHAGGVIAYPTEAVWGLGCAPLNRHACEQLLHLKQRDWRKGLILIAAEFAQLRPYLAEVDAALLRPALATWPGPATWLVPASKLTPEWVRGEHDSVAVRVTAHPLAAALCRAYGGAIVSTSANRAGQAPAMTATQVRLRLGRGVDVILPGALGGLERPTPIRDLRSGKLLRA
ncbi:MAG: tRNA threonylcarbamoyladenosine biosynthesis protein RimN [Nevskiaceae bacterium]|nr:MAG: tRNA threonylcarbamoyladenosine biosynthesis protein RimN [Nevskiaceae bacterium]